MDAFTATQLKQIDVIPGLNITSNQQKVLVHLMAILKDNDGSSCKKSKSTCNESNSNIDSILRSVPLVLDSITQTFYVCTYNEATNTLIKLSSFSLSYLNMDNTNLRIQHIESIYPTSQRWSRDLNTMLTLK